MLSFVDIDQEHDLAYILLRPELRGRRGAVARSVRVAEDIVLDLDESGHLIGIELLNASARLDVDDLETGSREIIVGVKEAAEMLRVEKSNFVRDYANKPDFPAPIAELASGRLWLRSAIERYVEGKKKSTKRPPETARGDAMARATTIQIQGEEYRISDNDVRRVARSHTPGSIVGYYVDVDGKPFPPKQLIRLTTGTRDRFNSANARSALTRLGFVVRVAR